MPAARAPVSLLAVDRAVSEMRRGRTVVLQGANGTAALCLSAEGVSAETLKALTTISGSVPHMAITGRRAHVLNVYETDAKVVHVEADFDIPRITALADPLQPLEDKQSMQYTSAGEYSCDAAAVGLAKIARLLPAVVVADLNESDVDDLAAWTLRHDLLMVDAGDIFQYEHTSARTLTRVSEAAVPLEDAENARVIAFRPQDGGLEHLAIVIGEPDPTQPVLTRLHSECFTGDLLGSLRCDCGDQLRGAIQEIAKHGGGVLLYLAQEGRGIGLVNKLRAYELQDSGHDTVDANEQLGYDADERVYLPAARMLSLLGFNAIRLMTNNPAKVASLSRHGIDVSERVTHAFPANKHNERYLETKAQRSGHLF